MKIGVIGLGLIGGSIFKGLKDKYEVVGVSNSVKEVNVSGDYNTLKECELVFVCTPMRVTLDVLDKLEGIVTPDTIVTDVCSLKEFVSQKEYSYKFIPSHPMAGTENSGWEASFADLFKGAKWVLTPKRVIREQAALEGVIKELGAEIVITTPKEHDKAVAMISHMPMVIAQALCKNILNDKLAQTLAASGFRDTTRLALSNIVMADDMISMNGENIRAAIDSLTVALNNLLGDNYREQAENIKKFRISLY